MFSSRTLGPSLILEVWDTNRESVAITSSSGDGAKRWSESQNESSPHSSAFWATAIIVCAEGIPIRHSPKPTPIFTCLFTWVPHLAALSLLLHLPSPLLAPPNITLPQLR